MHLGLDLGTSGVKGLLIDDDQTVIAEARAGLDVIRPESGWSEQNPETWLEATRDIIRKLGADRDLKSVKSIGLSGHMHGATLIDSEGQVLRPCILWNDTRAAKEAAEMDANPKFREISGNIVFPGFTAPKLAWARNHEPKIFEATAKVLLPKDYLRFWLTGEAVSEMSDAAGTSWLNTNARDWSPELLELTGLAADHMPNLVEGSDVSGGLRAELAAEWGMKPDTPVAGGGGDNAATAIGTGVTRDGQAFLSLGTSGVLFAACDSYSPAPETAVHTFCHALPNTWHQMGVILSAADSLEWYSRFVGKKPAELAAAISKAEAPGRTLFLPYLGGERTPHNDAHVRGSFLGIEHVTDTASGTRAIFEGVAFALKDSLDALAATGTKIERLIAVGGGSQSRAWLEIIATALALPIDVPEAGDFGAAFGAARLGMMAATGETGIASPPPISETIDPVASLIPAFSEAHNRYQSAYTVTRNLT